MFLLLTGTVNPSVFNNTNVKIIDVQERLNQYVNSIKKYIACGIFDKVAFVENSGYDFPTEDMCEYALKYNVQFELIPIVTDVKKTILYGKSYGEADCIEKGITNSKLIQDEEYFTKCTGRVFIKNIDKLCSRNQNTNKFLFRDDMNWCYTVIFQMNIEEYKRYFFKSKEICDERMGIDIEKAFYKIIIENNIQFKCFRSYPNIEGLCGTTGTAYNEKYFMKNIFTKLGLFSHNRFNKTIYKMFAPVFIKISNILKGNN